MKFFKTYVLFHLATMMASNPIRRRTRKSSTRFDSIISCEIPFHHIKVDKQSNIGSGTFGTVHKAQDFYHGLVAIKFLNIQKPSEDQINGTNQNLNLILFFI